MWPPRANPKVTAGLTWPPEMLAPTETATKSAKPWQIATASNPAGSSAASDVNLPTSKVKKNCKLLHSDKPKQTLFLKFSYTFKGYLMFNRGETPSELK